METLAKVRFSFKASQKSASDQLWALKKDALVRRENGRILAKHTTANRNISQRTRTIIKGQESS